MLKAIFQQELKESMLARNELKTSVLRMLISAITYYEIQKGGAGYNANEEDVLKVIEKEAKQRKDSISQFMNANRQDLVDKEKGIRYFTKISTRSNARRRNNKICKRSNFAN